MRDSSLSWLFHPDRLAWGSRPQTPWSRPWSADGLSSSRPSHRTRSYDELLAAVDVERRAGEGPVRHDVNRERCDIGWSDDPPDRQRRAQLGAPGVQGVAKDRRGQRRVDEARRDEVDPDRRELEGERGD